MARVACRRGWNVCRALTAGAGSVMARGAGSQYVSVIDPRCRTPQSRAVARFTPLGRRKVRRRFADRIDTVVATIASIDNAWVAKRT